MMSTSTSCSLSEMDPPLASVPHPAVQHFVPSGIIAPTEKEIVIDLDLTFLGRSRPKLRTFSIFSSLTLI